jgi:hypothetical protein
MFTLDTFLPYLEKYIIRKEEVKLKEIALELLKVTYDHDILRIDLFCIQLIQYYLEYREYLKESNTISDVKKASCKLIHSIHSSETLTYFEKAFMFIAILDLTSSIFNGNTDFTVYKPLTCLEKLENIAKEKQIPFRIDCIVGEIGG